MAMEFSSRNKPASWAISLKEKLCDQLRMGQPSADPPSLGESSQDEPAPKADLSLSEDLGHELLQALDLLLLELSDSGDRTDGHGGSSAQQSANPASDINECLATGPPQAGGDWVERVIEVVDSSLADWQASIAGNFGRSIAQELETQLKTIERLHADFREREERLSVQMAACQKQHAEQLRQHAKLTRQRSNVAKSLRARKAEMLLEVERERRAYLEDLSQETEDQQRAELQAELDQLRAQLSMAQEKLHEQQLQLEVAACQERNTELGDSAQLQAALDLFQQSLQEERDGMRADLKRLTATLEQQCCCQENTEIKSHLTPSPDGNSARELELQNSLDRCLEEIGELKSRNVELADRLERRQVQAAGVEPPKSLNQEGLSWEERKALMLEQLEHDVESGAEDAESAEGKRLQIEEVIASTRREVENRDREIAELKSMLEHQSETRQEVAIGASAIAGVLDADELIVEEREKLQRLQQEWEEKLRQAEIDLSMERAKLARERTRLEEELENIKSTHEDDTEPNAAGRGKTRRWLEHLGLRDENQK